MADHLVGCDLESVTHRLVSDLHEPRPAVYWVDLGGTAVVGWTAFVLAVVSPLFSIRMLVAATISAFILYRGLCFTHELTHLRRRSDVHLSLPLVVGRQGGRGRRQSGHQQQGDPRVRQVHDRLLEGSA
jgi:hypothetical protein